MDEDEIIEKGASYADKLCSARDGRACPETENVQKSGAKAVSCDVQSNTDDSEDSTTFGHFVFIPRFLPTFPARNCKLSSMICCSVY